MKQRPSGGSNLGVGRLRNLKPRIFSQLLSREAACSITLDRFSDILHSEFLFYHAAEAE